MTPYNGRVGECGGAVCIFAGGDGSSTSDSVRSFDALLGTCSRSRVTGARDAARETARAVDVGVEAGTASKSRRALSQAVLTELTATSGLTSRAAASLLSAGSRAFLIREASPRRREERLDQQEGAVPGVGESGEESEDWDAAASPTVAPESTPMIPRQAELVMGGSTIEPEVW
ncbi:hypothetical protein CF326_g9539 [Tilletia indica]|nr:hypothetical protein CF326_g9539 [Tilletia indica]